MSQTPMRADSLRIAFMGTRGAPALYGGFETAVEEIGSRLASRGHQVTVYCRNPGQKLTQYKGMKLVNLPAIHQRMAETLSHTGLSTAHALFKVRPDVCFLMNAGNAPFLPVLNLAKIPTAIHLDGLESKREKWRGAGAKYYTWAEKSAVKNGKYLIADAQAIADYIQLTYHRDGEVIAYGAEVLPSGERTNDFHLIVARLEPENHVLEAILGYVRSGSSIPLKIVGNAPYSDWYINKLKEASSNKVEFLGGVYNQDELNGLYANCLTYTHGHSVGGTNPGLLRAMGAGAPTLAFDCEFNREVTDNEALYWRNADEYAELLQNLDSNTADTVDLENVGSTLRERVASVYQWDLVTNQYETLARKMANTS
jgi:glycosyltransferase involved in cell wall biosynthesis